VRRAVLRFVLLAGASGCRSSATEPTGQLGWTASANVGQDADVAAALSDDKGNAKTAPGAPSASAPVEHRAAPPVARWATWPIPNFAASGLPHPQSYDTSTAGTVLDLVTGLMWQRKVAPGTQTFDDAIAGCDDLRLAGHHDWRLPSRMELVSILDLAETEPSIDRSVFAGTPSDWFWTSSVAADSPTAAWYVYFYFGYPKTDERTSPFRARCVRTEKAPAFTGDPDTHYTVRSTSVHDQGTDLTWQRATAPAAMSFDAALDYCLHLKLEGHPDWRLPSMPELVSLVDERASNPAIDAKAFPGTPSESFWTSSRFGNKSAEAWHVYFDHGAALYGLLKATHRVRCVR
jgi:hypothetical protein